MKHSLREDLQGIEFVERAPQVVLVGDLGEELSYDALNRGFRFLLDEKVAFITLARNRYFRGRDGLCLDVGATVAALEYASQRTAVLIGKPAREFFGVACQSMGVAPEDTIVIGDDLEADIGGALAAGCSGVLVRTGKFRPEQLETDPSVPTESSILWPTSPICWTPDRPVHSTQTTQTACTTAPVTDLVH